jgi:alpha-ketoglutarate-dependent 2,4-dichlorophenoxyacetate dioxygenase
MNMTIMPVTAGFVAEVGDIDLAGEVGSAERAAIIQAFTDYAVLIFPEQQLTPAQQVDFAQWFGPIEDNVLAYDPKAVLRVTPKLVDISNLTPDNTIWAADARLRGLSQANQLWHTDSSFKRLPARMSMLYAHTVVPLGGHTEYADMRAAYDTLSPALKSRCAGLVAMHALAYSRAKCGFAEFTAQEQARLPPVPQMLVRRIAENGRTALYLASHIGEVLGLDSADATALLEELMQHATQRQFVYLHRWRVHDLVMWDNRCTMHRSTPYDDLRYVRDMHRATVSDLANTCEQAGIEVPLTTAHAEMG